MPKTFFQAGALYNSLSLAWVAHFAAGYENAVVGDENAARCAEANNVANNVARCAAGYENAAAGYENNEVVQVWDLRHTHLQHSHTLKLGPS